MRRIDIAFVTIMTLLCFMFTISLFSAPCIWITVAGNDHALHLERGAVCFTTTKKGIHTWLPNLSEQPYTGESGGFGAYDLYSGFRPLGNIYWWTAQYPQHGVLLFAGFVVPIWFFSLPLIALMYFDYRRLLSRINVTVQEPECDG
jgi:hypothetical protein